MTTDGPLRVAVVGLGYWGPNLARNFAALPESELTWCCDASESMRARYAPAFPTARFTILDKGGGYPWVLVEEARSPEAAPGRAPPAKG